MRDREHGEGDGLLSASTAQRLAERSASRKAPYALPSARTTDRSRHCTRAGADERMGAKEIGGRRVWCPRCPRRARSESGSADVVAPEQLRTTMRDAAHRRERDSDAGERLEPRPRAAAGCKRSLGARRNRVSRCNCVTGRRRGQRDWR